MIVYSLLFLLGNIAVHQFSDLSASSLLLFSAIALFVIFIVFILGHFLVRHQYKTITFQICVMFIFFSSGFIYTYFQALNRLDNILAQELEQKELLVQGTIASVVQSNDVNSRFLFDISQIHNSAISYKGQVRLSYYFANDAERLKLKAGQQWQLRIKLKRPDGFMNPGGFDYEKWLFQNNIMATGYIRPGSDNQYLGTSGLFHYRLQQWRENHYQKLLEVLKDNEFKGIFIALTLGLKNDIDKTHWQILTATGTNHLMAISGLHIGLLAAIGFFSGRWLWSALPRLLQTIPAQQVGAVSAIVFAFIYAALAGFAIPTQRALIMCLVLLGAILFRSRLSTYKALSIALILVLLADPMSSLSMGFWLSFMAVAVILISINKFQPVKKDESDEQEKLFQRFIQSLKLSIVIQIGLFLGLMPLLLLFFSSFSLMSPIANLLIVPWMSILVIPLSLLASFTTLFCESLSLILFDALEWLLYPVLWLLKPMSELTFNRIDFEMEYALLIILLCAGLIFYKAAKHKAVIISMLLILTPLIVFYKQSFSYQSPQTGEYRLSVLDVGQGLSVLIETEHHQLLYDTGNYYSPRFNSAENVILPLLKDKKIDKLDRLVISHVDKDHAGSSAELIDNTDIKEIITGQVKTLKTRYSIDAEPCIEGSKWNWDGVEFEFIYSVYPKNQLKTRRSNNFSCVLKIRSATGFISLIPGDAEAKVEKFLVKQGSLDAVNVLIAGHHGSQTSSSWPFLQKIQPEIVIFSAGYKNSFNFPAKKIVRRFQAVGSHLLTTGNGLIEVNSHDNNQSMAVQQYRVQAKRYWHRAPDVL